MKTSSHGVKSRGHQTQTHRRLKFLTPELTRDPEAKDRLVREAQSASALDHPYIGTVYEINETEDGQLFIAMAHYEEETVKQKIVHGPLLINKSLELAM